MCVDARIGGMVTKEKEYLSLCLVTTEWMEKDAERKNRGYNAERREKRRVPYKISCKSKSSSQKAAPPAAVAAEASPAAIAKS